MKQIYDDSLELRLQKLLKLVMLPPADDELEVAQWASNRIVNAGSAECSLLEESGWI